MLIQTTIIQFCICNHFQWICSQCCLILTCPLCDRLYVALATLTEPHQLTATLNCVTSVARALVRPDASYPEGRSHVLPLLQLVLPGIDPNDFRKALVSTFGGHGSAFESVD